MLVAVADGLELALVTDHLLDDSLVRVGRPFDAHRGYTQACEKRGGEGSREVCARSQHRSMHRGPHLELLERVRLDILLRERLRVPERLRPPHVQIIRPVRSARGVQRGYACGRSIGQTDGHF